MHRRNFLVHCGLAAAGTLFLPLVSPAGGQLRAANLLAGNSAQVTAGDRVLLGLLSAYGTDAYFWGGGVFARATGLKDNGATNLLVRVDDLGKLVAFLRSDSPRGLGKIRSAGNSLSFTFRGTAYTVTNADPAEFGRAVSGGGVGRTDAAVFTSQTLLYHPATDTLSDPQFALRTRSLELATEPTGGVKARFQTVLDGWLEAHQHGLKLGRKFAAFQDDLLASEPTAKAARKVVTTLLKNISALAAAFDLDALKPLLLSPLVSGSLESELGVTGQEVLDDLTTLLAELAADDYSDAALWLATLLGPQIKDGTAGEWLDLLTGDANADTANKAALAAATRLVQTPGFATR